jgi:integrase
VSDAIDLDNGCITLQTLKRRKRGIVRQIPLRRSIVRELAREFQIHDAQLDSEKASYRLWPWSRTTAWRLIKKVMAAAGIVGTPARPKGLRHSFGVLAFQGNVPPASRAALAWPRIASHHSNLWGCQRQGGTPVCFADVAQELIVAAPTN